MKKHVFLPLLVTLSYFVFSNDSRTVLGSSVEIIDNENTHIVMREEEINISLHRDFYEVAVTFDFYNSGPAETVSLGFPVYVNIQDYPENRDWARIYDFRSSINGNLLPHSSVREEVLKDGDSSYTRFTKWYIREVVFPEKSHTYSKVTYKAPYNNSGFYKYSGYIYGTGINWKNAIGKMTVYINHGDDIIIDSVNIARNAAFNFSWEANGRYKYTAENIEPESVTDDITIGIKPFDMYGEYHNEFGDFHAGWILDRALLYREETDIHLFTKNQIRLFINFFYAFHGYDFKNPLYKNYFTRLKTFYDDNSTKYRINPGFRESDFTEYERKNIDFLLRMEKMIPELFDNL